MVTPVITNGTKVQCCSPEVLHSEQQTELLYPSKKSSSVRAGRNFRSSSLTHCFFSATGNYGELRGDIYPPERLPSARINSELALTPNGTLPLLPHKVEFLELCARCIPFLARDEICHILLHVSSKILSLHIASIPFQIILRCEFCSPLASVGAVSGLFVLVALVFLRRMFACVPLLFGTSLPPLRAQIFSPFHPIMIWGVRSSVRCTL